LRFSHYLRFVIYSWIAVFFEGTCERDNRFAGAGPL
jgi:hypothetical protein